MSPRNSRAAARLPSSRLKLWLTLLATLSAVLLVGAAVMLTLDGRRPDGTPVAGSPSPQSPGATLVAMPTTTGDPISPPPSLPPGATPTVPARPLVATRIRIERLEVDLPIVPGDGRDAPMHRAAHYPGSAWPYGGSNIYIYGHAQEGMLLNLWQVRLGDEVVLQLEDGGERRYKVTRVVPDAPWNAVEYTYPTDHEQLTLQTSTSTSPAAPRFIVIALPAP
ncbi:hypothetical protein BH23CHL7_BH23CHL7_06360 [soil metagenome]